MQPRTIQIFLPDGNPRGLRIAEITSRTVQVIQIPRAQLEVASTRPEMCSPGVYFLVGDVVEAGTAQVYVGEAEDCLVRLKQHQKQKDFWTTIVAAISKTQHFTKTHVKFLEWYCYKAIEKANRYSIENATEPSKPHVPESMAADLIDNFETLKSLASTLGFPLFDEIKKPSAASVLRCRGRDADARGEYTEEGLVVFADSTANLVESASAGPWVIGLRSGLIQSGVLQLAGKVYRFTKDYVFTAPSAAAAVVLARHANGWTEWKFADGRTLDEVIRQPSSG